MSVIVESRIIRTFWVCSRNRPSPRRRQRVGADRETKEYVYRSDQAAGSSSTESGSGSTWKGRAGCRSAKIHREAWKGPGAFDHHAPI